MRSLLSMVGPRALVRLAGLFTLVLVFVASEAGAEWTVVGNAPVGGFLSDAAVDGDVVVVVGADIDTAGMIPEIEARVYRSTDGGQTFEPLHDGMPSGSFGEAPGAVGAVDDLVVVVLGSDVLLRDESGQWTSHDVGVELEAVAFVGKQRAIGVGEGGAIRISEDQGRTWNPVDGGTSVDLRGMFWSGSLGFAWGWNESITGGGFDAEEEREIMDGVLLRSEDGGGSWETVRQTDGVMVGPAWVNTEGRGLLGESESTSTQGPGALLSLRSTSDGGRNWSELELPTEVGSVSVPVIGSEPIDTSYLISMFQSGDTMRLATTAHVGDSESSEAGGGANTTQRVSDFRIVSYVSMDAGQSWDFDGVGEVELSFSGQSEGDGEMLVGTMGHFHDGRMVAVDGRVWGLSTPCTDDALCLGGSACEAGQCGAEPGADTLLPAPGDTEGQAAGPGAGGSGPDGHRPGGAEGAEGGESGCSQNSASGFSLAAICIVVLLMLSMALNRRQTAPVRVRRGRR